MFGMLLVISGPSGVGKGTLCRLILERQPSMPAAGWVWSVSATTRAKRPGEVNGVDYFFETREAFEAQIKAHGFLEWAEYNGCLYGTPKAPVDAWRQAGKNVLLEIDVQGALQIKRHCPEARLLFIAPPSMKELARRLDARGTNHQSDQAARLAIAQNELSQQDQFDAVIVNDDLERAYQQIVNWLGCVNS